MRRLAALLALSSAAIAVAFTLAPAGHAAGDYGATVLADSPIAYYDFSNPSNRLSDQAGNGHDGSYSGQSVFNDNQVGGGPSFTAQAPGGSANTGLRGDQIDLNQAHTIELWIKTGPPADSQVFGWHNMTNAWPLYANERLLAGAAGGLVYERYDGFLVDMVGVPSSVAFDSAWHLVDVAYDPLAGSRFYLDGHLAGTGRPLPVSIGSSITALLGSEPGGNGAFSGSTAQVSVYGYALGSASVLAHYDAAAEMSAAPVNQQVPSISGTATLDAELAGSDGVWAPQPQSATRNWVRCDNGGANCVAISGATASSYRPTALDVGQTIRLKITARGIAPGSTTEATSAPTAAVAVGDPYAEAVLADHPAALFRFTSGAQVADSTGLGHDGNYHGAANNIPVSFGTLGRGVSFSGASGSYADTALRGGDLDSNQPHTIELWIKAPIPAGAQVFGWHNMTNASPQYANERLIAGAVLGHLGLTYERYDGSTVDLTEIPAAAVFDNAWHLVDIAYRSEGGSLLYLDGTLVASGDALTVPIGANVTATIGAESGGGYPFAGSLANVAVYDHALASDRVLAHYADGSELPVATNLTIHGDPATDNALSLPLNQLIWINQPSSVSEQWLRCDANGANCTDLLGETGETHTLVGADVGQTLRVEVAATNDQGTNIERTSPSAVVPSLTPTIRVAPAITGSATLGSSLTGINATWNHFLLPNSQWELCDETGGACELISGSPGVAPLTIDSSMIGHTIRFASSADGIFGATTVESRPTPVIIDEASLEKLAFAYRPALLFDTNEPYRPITLDSFFAEGIHTACVVVADSYCKSLTSPTEIVSDTEQLAQDHPGVSRSYIGISHDGDAYASPSAPCGPDGNLVDCGDQPGIYFDFAQSTTGYRFLDYWVFYRNNPVSGDNHAGDWEGMTVWLAPTATPDQPAKDQIAGVIFAEHTKNVFRLPMSLQFCPSGATTYEDCDNAAASAHVADYVALNSHASYETGCHDTSCANPENVTSGYGYPDEGRHNGLAGWSANDDGVCRSVSGVGCVIPLTPIDGAAAPDWATYAGAWGGSTGNGIGFGASPSSPGIGHSRYTCTQAGWSCGGIDTGHGDPVPDGTRSTAVAHTHPKPSAFSLCRSWWDTGLAAYACSPSRWAKTVAAAQTNVPGRFKLVISERHTGSAPGLVQVLGGPLRHPATVRFVGRAEKDEIVAVNYFSGGRVWVVRLTKLSAQPGAALHLAGNGKPIVTLHALKAHVSISHLS